MNETSSPKLRGLAQFARDRVREGHRSLVFQRAMRRLMRDPIAATSASSSILADLFYGWNNEGWSAKPEFLRACIQQALETEEPILECGSGLSTVVLGTIAQRMGNKLWALEHMPGWAERVGLQLNQFEVDSVRMCVAPLTNFGDYDWYTPPPEVMSERFGLVVCDGPPSHTHGGRYGLIPVMKACLMNGCVILLDDAERASEQAIALRWSEELPSLFTRVGIEKPFFRFVVENGPAVFDHSRKFKEQNQ